MLAAGETSVVELARVVPRTASRRLDERLHAFLTLTPEVALERAEELDVHRATGAPQQCRRRASRSR